MIKEKSQTVTYNKNKYSQEQRELPPKFQQGKIHSILRIALRVLWHNKVKLQNTIIKFKFWGEDVCATLDAVNPKMMYYKIMVPPEKFTEYLKDMKILKIEFEDTRNRKLISVGYVNFLLYLGISNKDKKNCLADITVTVGMQAISSGKQKIGEIEIMFAEELFQSNKLEERQQKFLQQEISNKNFTKKVVTSMNKNNIKQQLQNQDAQKIGERMLDLDKNKNKEIFNEKIEEPVYKNQRKMKKVFEILKGPVIEPRYHQQQHNFELEIERLKLDQLELLNSRIMITNNQSTKITFVVDRCESETKNILTASSEYQIQIAFPVVVQNRFKKNLYNLASLRIQQQRVIVFDQLVQIPPVNEKEIGEKQLRQYLNETVNISLWEKTQKEQTRAVSQGEIKLSKLLNELQSCQFLRVKLLSTIRQKKLPQFNLIIKSEKYIPHNHQKEHIIEQELESVVFNKTKISTTNNLNNRNYEGFFLCCNFTKFINLRKDKDRHTNYYLRIKVNEKVFVSETIWNKAEPNFNYLIIAPFETNNPMRCIILVELWNKAEREILVGLSKMSVGEILFKKQKPCSQLRENIYPFVLFDDQYPIKSLQDVQMGYLRGMVSMGTMDQINKLNAVGIREGHTEVIYTQSNSVSKQFQKKIKTEEEHGIVITEQNTKKLQTQEIKIESNDQSKQQQDMEDVQERFGMNKKGELREIQKTEPVEEPQHRPLIVQLNDLFTQLSLKQNYELLRTLIKNRQKISMHEFRNIIKQRLNIQIQEWIISKVSFLFLDDLVIDIEEFVKSSESHKEYREIILEELTEVIRGIRQHMDFNGVSIRNLEIEMYKYADRQDISKDNFKLTLYQLIPEVSALDMEILWKFNPQGQNNDKINIGIFCDLFREFDVFQKLENTRVHFEVLCDFIVDELEEIVKKNDEIFNIVNMDIPNHKILTVRNVMEIFLTFDISLTVWQVLCVVQTLKARGKRKQSRILQGNIYFEEITDWVSELFEDRVEKIELKKSPTFGKNLFSNIPSNGNGNANKKIQTENLNISSNNDSQKQKCFQNNRKDLNLDKFKGMSNKLPSPINKSKKYLRIESNFQLQPQEIFVNEEKKDFVIPEKKVLHIFTHKHAYYNFEFRIPEQSLYAQGIINQWLAVVDDQQNYRGALKILQ